MTPTLKTFGQIPLENKFSTFLILIPWPGDFFNFKELTKVFISVSFISGI